MKNAHLEPWDFGRPGWLNERASGFVVAPVRQNLKFEVLAWTPSTHGHGDGVGRTAEPSAGPACRRLGNRMRRALATAVRPAAGRRRRPVRLGTYQGADGRVDGLTRTRSAGRAVLIGKAAVIPVSFTAPQNACHDDRVCRRSTTPTTPTQAAGGGTFGVARSTATESRDG